MKKLGEGIYTDYKFSRAVWQGVDNINYVVVRDPKVEAYTRYYHSEKVRKGEIVIKIVDRKIRVMEKGRDVPVAVLRYNRENGEMMINIITNLGHQYLQYVFKEIFHNLKDFVPKNDKKVRWGFPDIISIWENKFVSKIDLYGGERSNKKYTCVYLFRGANILHLDDIDKNEENYINSSNKYLEIQGKYYYKFKNKIKGKYKLNDILNYGGLRSESGEYYARIFRGQNEYILKYPSEGELIITEKGYDLAGSTIWKCIILIPKYPYIRQVFLIGKEYTKQWWIHTVPPDFWRKSLEECEKWLLNLNEDDILENES